MSSLCRDHPQQALQNQLSSSLEELQDLRLMAQSSDPDGEGAAMMAIEIAHVAWSCLIGLQRQQEAM